MKLLTLFLWILSLAVFKVVNDRNEYPFVGYQILQALIVTLNSPFIKKRSKPMVLLSSVSQFMFTISVSETITGSVIILATADFVELIIFTVVQIRSKPSSFFTALVPVIIIGIGHSTILKETNEWWTWNTSALIIWTSLRTFVLEDLEPSGTIVTEFWSCVALVSALFLFYLDVWNTLLCFVTTSMALSLESNLALRVFSEVDTHLQTTFVFSLAKVMRSQLLMWVLSHCQAFGLG